MDEMTAIRNLLREEPPASPDVVAAARLRATGIPTPPRRRPPRIRVRWPVGVLGLAAGATAIAVAVITVAPVGGGSPPPSRTLDTGVTAKQILLAAAVTVEKSPSTGTYWHSRMQLRGEVTVPGHGYVVDRRSMEDWWQPASATKPNWVVTQDLGTAPATPADMRAWNNDGSPLKVRVVPTPGEEVDLGKLPPAKRKAATAPYEFTVKAAGGPAEAWQQPSDRAAATLGGKPVTLNQLRHLPADPGALAAELKRLLATSDRVTHRAAAPDWDGELFTAGRYLLSAPVSSPVRAATYRMIAALPGVTSRGKVRDPLGRSGAEVAIGQALSPGMEDQLVIDPGTGLPLAIQTVVTNPAQARVDGGTARIGQVVSSQIFLTVGWTSANPQLPKRRHGINETRG